MEFKKKYTAILHQYRSSKTKIKYIECYDKDLQIFLQDEYGWSLIHCFEGNLQDKLHELRSNKNNIPIKEWRKYKFSSFANFYGIQFSLCERFNSFEDYQKDIIFLFDKIEDNHLNYKDWFDSDKKILILMNDLLSINHCIINKYCFIIKDFLSGNISFLPHGGNPFKVLERGFDRFNIRSLKQEDFVKIEKCFNVKSTYKEAIEL